MELQILHIVGNTCLCQNRKINDFAIFYRNKFYMWNTNFFLKDFWLPMYVCFIFFGCYFLSWHCYLELTTKDNKASHKSFMSHHPPVTFTLNCPGHHYLLFLFTTVVVLLFTSCCDNLMPVLILSSSMNHVEWNG